MASILTGSIVADIRGSVGSESYSRNQYGNYVKARVTPTNPNTAAQIASRAALAASVAAWQALTQAQRDKYNALAHLYTFKDRLGISRTLNGYLIFIRQRALAVRAGIGFLSNVNAPNMYANCRILSLQLSVAALQLTLRGTAAQSNVQYSMWALPAQSASQLSFNPSKKRYLVSNGFGASDFTQQFKSFYDPIFGSGSYPSGSRIVFGIDTFNPQTAELTETQYSSGIVA